MDLRIGIENELFLEGPGDVPPPFADQKDIKFYADNKLVPFYNEKRGRDLLHSKFIAHSHPGHEKDHTDNDKWTVTTDVTMVEFDLNQTGQDVEGCTYSRSLRRVFIIIRLTKIQVPSNLSLRYLALALMAHGKKK